jgi:glycolate oxidase
MDTRLLIEFRSITGPRAVITSPEELHTYDSDALTNFRAMPQAVLLPSSTAEVQAILRLCHRERIPFVARGSATSPQRRYSRFFATSIN